MSGDIEEIFTPNLFLKQDEKCDAFLEAWISGKLEIPAKLSFKGEQDL